LSQQVAELRRALSVRDDFVAGAVIELRNALTPVISLSDHICGASFDQEAAGSRVVPMVAGLGWASRQFLRRATVLLEASRLLTGAPYKPSLSAFALSDLVTEALTCVQEGAAVLGCEFRADIQGDLRVLSDRVALDLIVDNLLWNAIKSGAGRPIAITLMQGALPNNDAIRLTVTDGGPALPVDESGLFEPFDSAIVSDGNAQAGVGIWVARQMLAALGGELVMQHRPDVGNVSAVTLPFCPPPK